MSQTKVERVAHLPASTEFVDYALPKVPADLMARVVGFFRAVYRRQRTEALVLLLWRDEGFDLVVPDQKVTPVSVSYDARRRRAAGRIAASSGRSTATAPSAPTRARSTRTTRRSSTGSTSSSATSTGASVAIRRRSSSTGIRFAVRKTGRSSSGPGGSSSRRRTGCGG